MGVLVWLFFLVEAVYQINFLWKLLLIILFSVHALVAQPDVNPEATRKIVAEKLAANSVEAEPATGTVGASAAIAVAKDVVMESVLVKQSPMLPALVKGLAADITAKEKTETDGEKGDKLFESLSEELSPFNALGLGVPATRTAAKESWMSLKGQQMDFGPKSKSSNAIKERIIQNISLNMPQYLHIIFALMCLRSLLFRSFFACLPWSVGYQFLFLNIPVDLIRDKFPQIPSWALDFKLRSLATMAFHSFMWLFFVCEAVIRTHLVEKILLLGLILAHAYIVSPVLK